MASRKRKTTGFGAEEELADVVNEIVNDSDSDTEGWYTRYHTLKHYWTLLKVFPKFQIFISYIFRVIIIFTEIMKEGTVDPLNVRHLYDGRYLNSWQRMC